MLVTALVLSQAKRIISRQDPSRIPGDRTLTNEVRASGRLSLQGSEGRAGASGDGGNYDEGPGYPEDDFSADGEEGITPFEQHV